jgi:hypothetical protein
VHTLHEALLRGLIAARGRSAGHGLALDTRLFGPEVGDAARFTGLGLDRGGQQQGAGQGKGGFHQHLLPWGRMVGIVQHAHLPHSGDDDSGPSG